VAHTARSAAVCVRLVAIMATMGGVARRRAVWPAVAAVSGCGDGDIGLGFGAPFYKSRLIHGEDGFLAENVRELSTVARLSHARGIRPGCRRLKVRRIGHHATRNAKAPAGQPSGPQ
jgi:hypothetical protein